MSDSRLRLIPTDPWFVPEPGAAKRARKRLAELVPDADEVAARVLDEVEFVDQGAGFERVSCPRCGAELGEDWWGEAISEAFEAAFRSLDTVVPCCGATVSLNDLSYDPPAGFARFVLEAANPSVVDLSPTDLAALGETLGIPLRRVWTRA